MAKPEFYEDQESAQEKISEYEPLKIKLESLMNDWEDKVLELEKIEQ